MILRVFIKTTLLTSAIFIGFYPSRADMIEMGLYWLAALAVLTLGAVITWKTEYPKATAWVGLRLAYRSWFRPDAPRAPSRRQLSHPAQAA